MTYLSIGVVGTGRVARLHVNAVSALPDVRVTAIAGRSVQAAQTLAPVGALATADVDRFTGRVAAAIVASPSPLHVAHARQLLNAGIGVLIELPVAASAAEAADLSVLATRSGGVLVGAHTTRWSPAITRIDAALRAGHLGVVEQVSFVRRVAARERTWTDDPLLHHGQHAIDALRAWFGDLALETATLTPATAAFTGRSTGGVAVDVSIVHGSDVDSQRIRIAGRDGSLTSDGFGWLAGAVVLDGDPTTAYHAAIAAQDRDFTAAMRGADPMVPFSETIANLQVMDLIRRLAT